MGGRVTKQSYAMAREPRKIESNVSLLRPRYQEMHMCASNGATVRSGAPFWRSTVELPWVVGTRNFYGFH